jgi:peptidoglycan/LPS O-acetylase OafA/YrhL
VPMGIIRILLALSVTLDHIGPIFGFSMLKGGMAVQAFFIISGFYISLILNEKYISKNKSYFLYISNRFLRIYPIYYIALLLTIILLISNNQFPSFQFSMASLLNIVKQLTIFVTNDYFIYVPETYHQLFVFQSWSLGLEFLFYLIAPLIVRKTRILLLFFGIGLFSRILFAHILYPHIYPGGYIDFFFPTEIVYFLAGALSYKAYVLVKKLNNRRLFSILSIFFIFLTLIYQIFYAFPYGNTVANIYYILLLLSMPFIFSFSKNSRFDRIIGDLAYPIYLLHVFISDLFIKFHVPKTDLTKLLIVATVIIFSYIVNVAIAIPLEKIRQSRVKKLAVEKVE